MTIAKRVAKAKNMKEAERSINSAYPDRRFWMFELTPGELADWTPLLEGINHV
jgi:hypothetical protein